VRVRFSLSAPSESRRLINSRTERRYPQMTDRERVRVLLALR
jgi:hypothetical protein